MNHSRQLILVTILAIALEGCSQASVDDRKVVGNWKLSSHGGGRDAANIESGGSIDFRSDGSFIARDVPNLVSKEDHSRGSMSGDWRIDSSRPVGTDLRPSVVLRDRDRSIDIRAKYSEYNGRRILTFSRDEEAGNWVKYSNSNVDN
jgi:hypothetical protein